MQELSGLRILLHLHHKNLKISGIFLFFFLHSGEVASVPPQGPTSLLISFSPEGKSLNIQYWFSEYGELASRAQI